MSALKLFVWTEVLTDYSHGMMVALAHDVEEARALLLEEVNYLPADDLAREPLVVEEPSAFIVWGGG